MATIVDLLPVDRTVNVRRYQRYNSIKGEWEEIDAHTRRWPRRRRSSPKRPKSSLPATAE
jgi:hypothetical protein